MKKNVFDLSRKSISSTFLHALTPFDYRMIVPGDKFESKGRYSCVFEPATGQIPARFSNNIMYVFVPMWQIYKDFNAFYNMGGGVAVPTLAYNPTTNTDNTKLSYYLLPGGTFNADVPIHALFHRAYAKTYYDIFAKKLLASNGAIPDPASWYSTAAGVDNTTNLNLLYTPYVSDYYNECTSGIYSSAATTIPDGAFTIADLKSALLSDNYKRLAVSFGRRLQDFIDSIFGVQRKSKDAVEIINFYSQRLTTNDTVNLADDQGKLISTTYGISPSVGYTKEFEDFGILLGLYWVSCDDVYYAKGIAKDMLSDTYSSCWSFLHPEVQGLAYENFSRINVNDNDNGATTLDVIGVSELYTTLRKTYNLALGEYCRDTRRANQVPHIRSTIQLNDISDVQYPDKTSFANMFANDSNHITLVADMTVKATRPVAKIFKPSEIVREFDNPIIL